MFNDNVLLVFSLSLFSGLTLLIEFCIAITHLILLKKGYVVRSSVFLTHPKRVITVITVGGIIAILNLVSVGIYAFQATKSDLIFLLFCVLLEIVLMKWLIFWYRGLAAEDDLDGWNMRFVFFDTLIFLNLFFLWIRFICDYPNI